LHTTLTRNIYIPGIWYVTSQGGNGKEEAKQREIRKGTERKMKDTRKFENKNVSYMPVLKGTVSADIGLHFRFWKIKLVLSAGPLFTW
jgi:hypothetical protein